MNDDNNNVPIESGDPNKQTLIVLMSGVIIVGVCALLGLGYLWFQTDHQSLTARLFPTSAPTHIAASVPTSTPPELEVPTLAMPDVTQQPLEKADMPPSFASAADAKTAMENGGDYLESYAVDFPDIPDINQPGDIYTYNVSLPSSIPLIWSYGWCTTTSEILDDNFKHIQIDFVVDDTSVKAENIAITDSSRDDGSPCRDYVVLVDQWTPGQHQLQTRVNFTQDINDGWNLYPGGVHTYEYIVSVYQ